MTVLQRRIEEEVALVSAAFAAFGAAVRGIRPALRRLAYQFGMLAPITKKQQRRMVRDYQRENRRPALIHNGKKPRRGK